MIDPPSTAISFQVLPGCALAGNNRSLRGQTLGNGHGEVFVERRESENFSLPQHSLFCLAEYGPRNGYIEETELCDKGLKLAGMTIFIRTDDFELPIWKLSFEHRPSRDQSVEAFFGMNSPER